LRVVLGEHKSFLLLADMSIINNAIARISN